VLVGVLSSIKVINHLPGWYAYPYNGKSRFPVCSYPGFRRVPAGSLALRRPLSWHRLPPLATQEESSTILHWVAWWGHLPIVQDLLRDPRVNPGRGTR